MLLAADTDSLNVADSTGFGFRSDSVPHETAALLLGGTVEHEVALSGSPLCGVAAGTVLRKTAVHELAHLWRTNELAFPGTFDHCVGQVAYDSPAQYNVPNSLPGTLYCVLLSLGTADPSVSSSCATGGTADAVEVQYANGITTFHMTQVNGQWHSEYLGIRNAIDPWLP